MTPWADELRAHCCSPLQLPIVQSCPLSLLQYVLEITRNNNKKRCGWIYPPTVHLLSSEWVKSPHRLPWVQADHGSGTFQVHQKGTGKLRSPRLTEWHNIPFLSVAAFWLWKLSFRNKTTFATCHPWWFQTLVRMEAGLPQQKEVSESNDPKGSKWFPPSSCRPKVVFVAFGRVIFRWKLHLLCITEGVRK